MTLIVVLQHKSSVSLPEAHSPPGLAPSFAGNIQSPSMPEPLASRSHRVSLLVLTLQESASGWTSEGQELGCIHALTLFCPLPPPIPLCAFPSLVSSKKHKDLLSLSGHRGPKTAKSATFSSPLEPSCNFRLL